MNLINSKYCYYSDQLSFFYSCDININCNVHVQSRYLISCVSRIEALSPISIYSYKIIALDISGQYVINIGVLRGGQGGLAPPPLNWLRCSKLEVADQQGVVNSRS